MALTNYYAIRPTVKSSLLGAPLASGATNLLQTGSTMTIAAGGDWLPNDYCVIVVNQTTANTTDPTTITSNGINFSKIMTGNGQSVWVGLNNTANIFPRPTITVNWGAARSAWLSAFIVTNATALAVGSYVTSTAVANGSAVSFGTVVPGASNKALIVGIAAVRRVSVGDFVTPVVSVPTIATAPPSVTAYTASQGQGAGVVQGALTYMFCSQGEPIDNTLAIAATVNIGGVGGGTISGISGFLYFTGAQVALDDLTCKIDIDGLLLNNPDPTLPVYDIGNIGGLIDLDVTNSSDAIDGTDGSYVEGRFISGKTVILDGTVIGAGIFFDESNLDNLKKSIIPKLTDKPFFFKSPSKNPRMAGNVTTISFKSDIDRGRSTNQVPFQIQLLTDDAFYTEIDDLTTEVLTTGSDSLTITPSGNKEAFPVFYFTWTTIVAGNIQFINYTWCNKYSPLNIIKAIQIDQTLLTPGQYKLDFKNRTLWLLNGGVLSDWSSAIVDRSGWWTLIPNVPNSILIVNPEHSVTMMAYRNSWL